MVQGHCELNCRSGRSASDGSSRLFSRLGIRDELRVPKRGRVGSLGLGSRDFVVGLANLRKSLEQPGVGLGRSGELLDLLPQIRHPAPGRFVTGVIDERNRPAYGLDGGRPPGQVVSRLFGLGFQDFGVVEQKIEPTGAPMMLVEHPDAAPTSRHDESDHRCRQANCEPSPRLLLERSGLGFHALKLSLSQSLMHSSEVARQLVGHNPGITRSIIWPRSQTSSRQGDQLGVGAAAAQVAKGIVQIGTGGQALDLPGVAGDIRRTAGQDFAEDGAESEHIRPLVHLIQVMHRCPLAND